MCVSLGQQIVRLKEFALRDRAKSPAFVGPDRDSSGYDRPRWRIIMERPKSPIRRCAIYTLKSSEEGLQQDFNSLHAQREACEAFIKSQAGEGWRLVKTAYDDGGLSGATMERPALQRLLSDINQGLIDVVVVYKVDRLTRRGVGLPNLVIGNIFQSAALVDPEFTICAHWTRRASPYTARSATRLSSLPSSVGASAACARPQDRGAQRTHHRRRLSRRYDQARSDVGITARAATVCHEPGGTWRITVEPVQAFERNPSLSATSSRSSSKTDLAFGRWCLPR